VGVIIIIIIEAIGLRASLYPL